MPTNDATITAWSGSSARHGKAQAFCRLAAMFNVLTRQIADLEVTSGGSGGHVFVSAHVKGTREAGAEAFEALLSHAPTRRRKDGLHLTR